MGKAIEVLSNCLVEAGTKPAKDVPKFMQLIPGLSWLRIQTVTRIVRIMYQQSW